MSRASSPNAYRDRRGLGDPSPATNAMSRSDTLLDSAAPNTHRHHSAGSGGHHCATSSGARLVRQLERYCLRRNSALKRLEALRGQ